MDICERKNSMVHYNPSEMPVSKFHGMLLSAVAPRPIALASTLNTEGVPNLSPFSFFNVFSANPPIAIFSPARRVRDNTGKHTLENVIARPEVVINLVSYSMVQQMSLSSCEYPAGVNEFVKAGFEEIPSIKVGPPGVKESPARLECKVTQVVPLGKEGGAGNLIICEVLLLSVSESVLNEAGSIDPEKMDLVARLGGDWYCRASGDALFEVPKPSIAPAIGVDNIPGKIRFSGVFSANDLGMLGNVVALPTAQDVADFIQGKEFLELLHAAKNKSSNSLYLHEIALNFLRKNRVQDAWKVLLSMK